jgi:hypothetical protein
VVRTKVAGSVRAYSTHRLDHSRTLPAGLACWKFHCGGLLPMEMPTDAAFGRATMPTARAPGFVANRAGPSRSFGAGRRLRVPGGSGSRGSRRVVYWVLGPTAASRRRPAAWLGARVGPTLFGSIAGVWTGKNWQCVGQYPGMYPDTARASALQKGFQAPKKVLAERIELPTFRVLSGRYDQLNHASTLIIFASRGGFLDLILELKNYNICITFMQKLSITGSNRGPRD